MYQISLKSVQYFRETWFTWSVLDWNQWCDFVTFVFNMWINNIIINTCVIKERRVKLYDTLYICTRLITDNNSNYWNRCTVCTVQRNKRYLCHKSRRKIRIWAFSRLRCHMLTLLNQFNSCSMKYDDAIWFLLQNMKQTISKKTHFKWRTRTKI